ncbi:unnamed protein product, partial [Rotaria sp. Silwood1]
LEQVIMQPTRLPFISSKRAKKRQRLCTRKKMLAIIICTVILILIGAAIGIALGVSLNRNTGSFRWNPTGIVVLGNGTAGSESNQLNRPFGIYIDNNDILYIT